MNLPRHHNRHNLTSFIFIILFFIFYLHITSADNILRTIAGTGSSLRCYGTGCYAGGASSGVATSSPVFSPYGVYVDSNANFYITDYDNYRVTKVDSLGIMTTIAGNGNPASNSNADSADSRLASIDQPYGITADTL